MSFVGKFGFLPLKAKKAAERAALNFKQISVNDTGSTKFVL